MNKAVFNADFVEAFTKTTELYELTEEEKQFVFRVFNRFRTLTIETREQMVKAFGHFPQTERERIIAAIGLSIFYGKSLKEELTIGLHNYRRQKLILRALRGIVVLTFPSGIAGYMLDVFSE
ncbi:MAG: hypothetical protein Q7K44_04130 [Candidatus Liptonbacteria bacterium]|nr:hypothetical protein [Candidatus Liptonbacteria bacterium]